MFCLLIIYRKYSYLLILVLLFINILLKYLPNNNSVNQSNSTPLSGPAYFHRNELENELLHDTRRLSSGDFGIENITFSSLRACLSRVPEG